MVKTLKSIKSIKKEYSPKWCSTEYTYIKNMNISRSRYKYRYDFLITFHNNKQLIIELDGRQHHEQVLNWQAPLLTQIRDKYKEFKARKYGISLIRCCQVDVFNDKNNWKENIIKRIKQYM